MIVGLERFRYHRWVKWCYRVVYVCRKCGGLCKTFVVFDEIGSGNSMNMLRYCKEGVQCCLCFKANWVCGYCYKRKFRGEK